MSASCSVHLAALPHTATDPALVRAQVQPYRDAATRLQQLPRGAIHLRPGREDARWARAVAFYLGYAWGDADRASGVPFVEAPRGGLRAVRTGYVMRRESKEPDRVFPTPPTWREVFRGSHRTYYAVLYQVGAPDL